MLREGMFLADRYEIIEQIGTGGMADVYKAKCHKLNRYVAIKVMKSEFSQDKTFVSKFWAEAQSAAGLVNPNVVNVYDVGVENGIYYIVMELVEGITLKKYIEKRGRLPYKEAVSIAIQVANGMDAAHKHNIVHRDIKPQNIIISKEGKVKVTDFGIAKKEKEEKNEKLEREKKMQKAMLDIKKKYGKNAILKGMNLQEDGTAMERNRQIGGHKA